MTYPNPSPARRGSVGVVVLIALVIVGIVWYNNYQAEQEAARKRQQAAEILGVGAAILGAAAASGNHSAPAPAPSSSGNSAKNQNLLDMWNKNQNPGLSFSCSHCGGSGRESFNNGTMSPVNRPCGWCGGTGKMQKR